MALIARDADAVNPVIDLISKPSFETLHPVVYPVDRVHSPISADMLTDLLQYTDINGIIQNDVFMKAGNSKLVSTRALSCFDGGDVNLGTYTNLQSTLDHFLAGNASGNSPFERISLATQVGRTAAWLVGGDPSPMEDEFTTIWPRVTLITFGEDDMAFPDLDHFANALLYAVDYALQRGSIPVIFSPVPCAGCPGGLEKSQQYRLLARSVAQYKQTPFVDLYLALDPLPNNGLGFDDIHMNTYNPGNMTPCFLTSQGLVFGYNTFNLLALQVLDRLRKILLQNEPAPDDDVELRIGSGSVAEPVVVSQFPFNDGNNLVSDGPDEVTDFDACGFPDSTAGHEIVYRLDLNSPGSLRVDLVSIDDAALAVWLFQGGTSGENCIDGMHKLLEAEVAAGTWYLVVEAFVDEEETLDGEYLILIDLQ